MREDMVRPFSSGSEWMDWEADNCARCLRVACPLRLALERAYLSAGEVSADVARRLNRHEYRVDDDNRFCAEIVFSEEDKVRHANWLALPKFSIVRDDGFVLTAGRWTVDRRASLLRRWSALYGPLAQLRLIPVPPATPEAP